jgi:predicted regulator of Ras-like GTPase activity (Roadblock/LC7/MglB family)
MSFSNFLEGAVERVNGAVAAMIIGVDGMTVEEHTTEQLLDIESLSAESSQVIRDVSMAAETLRLGEASEFTIASDLCGIIMRKINREYYVALVIKPGGNFGKGRFVLRTMVPKIVGEF